MDISKLFPFAVISAVTAVLLKKYKPEFSFALGLLAAVAVILAALSALSPVITLISQLSLFLPDGEENVMVLLKCVGLNAISQTASDICADCSQTALSKTVDLGGRAAVLITSLPLFYALANTALSFMKL